MAERPIEVSRLPAPRPGQLTGADKLAVIDAAGLLGATVADVGATMRAGGHIFTDADEELLARLRSAPVHEAGATLPADAAPNIIFDLTADDGANAEGVYVRRAGGPGPKGDAFDAVITFGRSVAGGALYDRNAGIGSQHGLAGQYKRIEFSRDGGSVMVEIDADVSIPQGPGNINVELTGLHGLDLSAVLELVQGSFVAAVDPEIPFQGTPTAAGVVPGSTVKWSQTSTSNQASYFDTYLPPSWHRIAGAGPPGAPGWTAQPAVDPSTGVLTWLYARLTSAPNPPAPVTLKGPKGDPGASGADAPGVGTWASSTATNKLALASSEEGTKQVSAWAFTPGSAVSTLLDDVAVAFPTGAAAGQYVATAADVPAAGFVLVQVGARPSPPLDAATLRAFSVAAGAEPTDASSLAWGGAVHETIHSDNFASDAEAIDATVANKAQTPRGSQLAVVHWTRDKLDATQVAARIVADVEDVARSAVDPTETQKRAWRERVGVEEAGEADYDETVLGTFAWDSDPAEDPWTAQDTGIDIPTGAKSFLLRSTAGGTFVKVDADQWRDLQEYVQRSALTDDNSLAFTDGDGGNVQPWRVARIGNRLWFRVTQASEGTLTVKERTPRGGLTSDQVEALIASAVRPEAQVGRTLTELEQAAARENVNARQQAEWTALGSYRFTQGAFADTLSPTGIHVVAGTSMLRLRTLPGAPWTLIDWAGGVLPKPNVTQTAQGVDSNSVGYDTVYGPNGEHEDAGRVAHNGLEIWFGSDEIGAQRTLEVQHLTPITVKTADIGDGQVTRAKLAPDALGGDFTSADRLKLDGIEAGAEVNIQSDWGSTDPDHDEYIRNKPTVLSRTDVQGEVEPFARTGSTQSVPAAKIGEDTVSPGDLVADTDIEKAAQRSRIGAIASPRGGWELHETLPDAGNYKIGDRILVKSEGQFYEALAEGPTGAVGGTATAWRGGTDSQISRPTAGGDAVLEIFTKLSPRVPADRPQLLTDSAGEGVEIKRDRAYFAWAVSGNRGPSGFLNRIDRQYGAATGLLMGSVLLDVLPSVTPYQTAPDKDGGDQNGARIKLPGDSDVWLQRIGNQFAATSSRASNASDDGVWVGIESVPIILDLETDFSGLPTVLASHLYASPRAGTSGDAATWELLRAYLFNLLGVSGAGNPRPITPFGPVRSEFARQWTQVATATTVAKFHGSSPTGPRVYDPESVGPVCGLGNLTSAHRVGISLDAPAPWQTGGGGYGVLGRTARAPTVVETISPNLNNSGRVVAQFTHALSPGGIYHLEGRLHGGSGDESYVQSRPFSGRWIAEWNPARHSTQGTALVTSGDRQSGVFVGEWHGFANNMDIGFNAGNIITFQVDATTTLSAELKLIRL